MLSRRSRCSNSAASPSSNPRSQSCSDSPASTVSMRRCDGLRAARAARSSGVIGDSVMVRLLGWLWTWRDTLALRNAVMDAADSTGLSTKRPDTERVVWKLPDGNIEESGVFRPCPDSKRIANLQRSEQRRCANRPPDHRGSAKVGVSALIWGCQLGQVDLACLPVALRIALVRLPIGSPFGDDRLD